MPTTRRSDTPGRILGYGGLALAIVGAMWLAWLSESGVAAVGMIMPLVAAVALTFVPTIRESSLIWLVSGAWSGFLGVLTFFSVGVIFLIATVFLLAAFLRANW